jgi:hypothetical protein
MKTTTLTKTTLPFAAVALLVSQPLQAATTSFDDFSSDPNLAGDWTEYNYYSPGSQDNVLASWSAADQDLDFLSTAGTAAATSIIGLYSTSDHTRSATESVTMTVNALDRTAGNWGFVGLMISAAPQYDYISGTTDSYTLRMNALGSGNFQFAVWRTVGDGGTYALDTGTSQTFSGSYVLDIERNGAGEYEFFANDALLYTTTVAASGDDFYDATAKDSLLNYQMIMGGDGAMTATVDDFGVVAVPEPSTTALLGLGGLALILRRRK